LFLVFIVAHTIHFGVVTARVLQTGGKGMFPGGRDVADAGGLGAVLGIFALFYFVAGVALLARRYGQHVPVVLCWAGRAATVFLGYMFVSTYLSLVDRSAWYAIPAALIGLAVVLDLFGPESRRFGCGCRAS